MAKKILPVVQTAGLCKTFKDFWRRPKVEAVKDLSMEIYPGEVFGLLGPNGSGKSTTIKMLLGLLYPSRGRISVFGKAPTDVSVKSRIGFLPEETYLYPFLVAHETLDYYGRLFRLPTRIRKERTEKLLDMVGLRHEAKRRLGEYSKGMARRIGLAQALINDPEFLILDEPTAGLDPIGTRQIKDVIRELGKKGKTILLSSHVLADVEDVSDRVNILYGGQQRAAGDVSELLKNREVTQITVPTVTDETVQRIRELVDRLEQKNILEVSHPRTKLEDFFLKIVEEAQAARVKTYGAMLGGAVPEFLSTATSKQQLDVVDSLVAAAERRPEPIAPNEEIPAATTDQAVEEASKKLIDALTGKEASAETAQDTENPAAEEATSTKIDPLFEPKRPKPQTNVDRSVLDSLLDKAEDKDEN